MAELDKHSLRRIEATNYVLTGVGAAIATVFLPQPDALGLLAGGVLGAINFSLLRRVVERWIDEAASNSDGKSGYFLIPKMVGLLGLVFITLRYLPISAPFFALGFSVFLASIAIESVRTLARPRGTTHIEGEDDDDLGD